jgi:hypothetical protein
MSRRSPRESSPGAVFADKTAENLVKLALKVNGVTKKLEVDSRVVLLMRYASGLAYRLEEGLRPGQCGACTVLVNGRRVLFLSDAGCDLRRQRRHDDRGTREGRSTPPDAGGVHQV